MPILRQQAHVDTAISLDALPLVTTARRDTKMATTVNHGVAMQASLGTKAATQFLAAQGVPLSVTLRVLLHPAQRRR